MPLIHSLSASAVIIASGLDSPFHWLAYKGWGRVEEGVRGRTHLGGVGACGGKGWQGQWVRGGAGVSSGWSKDVKKTCDIGQCVVARTTM